MPDDESRLTIKLMDAPLLALEFQNQRQGAFHAAHGYASLPPVLDPCCSCRKFWFDPHDERAIFCDKRQESRVTDVGTPGTQGRKPLIVEPDLVADFTAMPFPDESFYLVVFDPPHMEKLGDTGHYAMAYGKLRGEWRNELRKGFAECFRVLKPMGTLIFKWCEVEIPLSEILKLTPEKPLFGHRSGKAAKTHWCAFLKHNDKLTHAE